MLTGLPEGSARDRREIELQSARGLSLFTTEGFRSAGAAEAYRCALDLAEQSGTPRQRFTAVSGLWQSANGTGSVRDCLRLSDRLQQLAAAGQDDELRLEAHHSAWTTHSLTGEPVATREHCEAGLRLYDPERHSFRYQLYGGHDPGICGLSNSANANWRLGYAETGLGISRKALSLAERISHPFSLELALVQSATLHLFRREPELTLQRLRAAEDLVAQQRLAFIQEPRFFRGAALAAQGAHEDAVACLREGLASPLGATRTRPFGLAALAEVLARQSEHQQALAAAKEGLEVQERTGQRGFGSELRRLEGIALFGLNRLEEGENALKEALRIARDQHAKSYELRAATGLARLWGEQGRRAEARALLAPVYGWFTEGFDTADLKEAKALLDELG